MKVAGLLPLSAVIIIDVRAAALMRIAAIVDWQAGRILADWPRARSRTRC